MLRINKNTSDSFIAITLICSFMLLAQFGCIPSRKTRVERRVKKAIDGLPFYMKISSSTEYIPDEVKKHYIDKVRNHKMKNGNTYNYELSNSFPSVPGDMRRWEFHRYNGVNYVCYVIRLEVGSRTEFIWKISDNNGVINFEPENIDAGDLLIIDTGKCRGMDRLRKSPESDSEGKKKNTIDELPLYLKISSSTEVLPDKAKKRYIDEVRNHKMNNGKTYDYELSNSFPSVPKDKRSWEFYRFKGKNYVCYIIRTEVGGQIPFIWEVVESYGVIDRFHPENTEAGSIFIIENGLRPGISKRWIKELRKLPDSERMVVEFLMDRETNNKNPDFYDFSVKIASKKFNIPEDRVRKISSDFSKAISNF